MTHFTAVTPSQVLLEWPRALLPSHHLMLAHDVSDKSDNYARAARRIRSTHPFNSLIHMDNSVVETGGAVDLDLVLNACEIVQATTACLPDVIGDGPATQAATLEALPRWVEAFELAGITPGVGGFDGFMVIPQGETFEAFLDCATALSDYNLWIKWWGVPRRLADDGMSRRNAAIMLKAITQFRKIHFLGFAEDITQDVLDLTSEPMNLVETIDSAVPLRAASLGIDFQVTAKLPPRGDWWETAHHEEMMGSNIAKYQRWIDS